MISRECCRNETFDYLQRYVSASRFSNLLIKITQTTNHTAKILHSSKRQIMRIYFLKLLLLQMASFRRRHSSTLNPLTVRWRNCFHFSTNVFLRACFVFGELLQTRNLGKSHQKRSQEVRSGDVGGRVMSPNPQIFLPGKMLLILFIDNLALCTVPPS